MKPRLFRILFVLSGIFFALGLAAQPPDPMPLIYTTFVVGCLCRRRIAGFVDRFRGALGSRLLVSFWIVGIVTEILAWSNNYLKAAANPAVFHPQLLADLIIGLGFYGGWALAWWLAMRWYRFTVYEAFWVTGLQGIFFEQLGAVVRMILSLCGSRPFQAGLVAAYVIVVHGSIAGLALLPWLDRDVHAARSRHWSRFPLIILLMVGFAFIGSWLAAMVTLPFGGLPPKRSIIEHPFW